MDLIWAIAGAAAGLPIGTVLRNVIFRLAVPSGVPERRDCQACVSPVTSRLAAGCRHCGKMFGPPAVIEIATALVLFLVLGRFGGRPGMAAFCFLGVLGVALAAIDIKVQRLPDRLTLPAYPLMIALLAAAALTDGTGPDLVRALLGGIALAACYLLLALARPGQMGGGDIKLAGLAGLALGWLGWPSLVTGAALGFLLCGAVTVAMLATRRITLRASISFGPFLLAGTLIAALMAGSAGS
jgi:leader peptidase (prepilin peptidase)/N-methyltransferase